MKSGGRRTVAPYLVLLATSALAQDRVAGTAVVSTDNGQHTIPIECNDAARPELGFSTEPARITKERTGRTSSVRLTLRPWQDTGYVVVSLDRYVAWVESPTSGTGILSMTLDMSPASVAVDGVPKALTFDEWMSGNRPAGLDGVTFEANCSFRDPEAPSFQKAQ